MGNRKIIALLSQSLLRDVMSAKMILFNERFIFRNVQELESSLDEVRKAILRESKVTDKDIEKTKKRIEELHRYYM